MATYKIGTTQVKSKNKNNKISNLRMEDIRLQDGTIIKQLSYSANNVNGWFVRGFNNERKEYLMLDSFFDKEFPRWNRNVKVPLVKGEGIPMALYMDLVLMKKFEINPDELKAIRICNVHEWDSVFHLNNLSRKHDENTDLGLLFKETRLFKSRNNVIIQTGLKITDLKILTNNVVFNHPQHLKTHRKETDLLDIKNLCNKYEIDFMEDQIMWNFDVLIQVSSKFN